MPRDSEGKPEIFKNPVYPHSFPDPFVLKFRDEYFAYCTGAAADGNIFSILHSRDLVNWSEVGSAMSPLDTRPPYYWAPEVSYDNGKFYLYYSAGNEILMEIRVAVSDRPEGPFVDAGVRLTNEEFAIDAHVFVDDDGKRYFFYATDFLEYAQIGTGTVVDRMLDWKTLEGHPRPVTRAKYDWQVYDPARKEKGGVRWYTVEGPTVLKRKGKYFEMFSGGNWKNKTYGVSFAVSNDIWSDQEWKQYADGEKVFPVLRTIPDKVVGPGHNSVVLGPNNRELYCIYHRWTDAGRVLAIDRMGFAGDRIFVAGPTTEPQIAPFQPKRPRPTTLSTGWNESEGIFVSSAEEACTMTIEAPDGLFLLETTVRFKAWSSSSTAGMRLVSNDQICDLSIRPEQRLAEFGNRTVRLPDDFDASCYHRLRVDICGEATSAMIDTPDIQADLGSPPQLMRIELYSTGAAVEFSAVEITSGFEELFDNDGRVPSQFNVTGGTAEIADGRMVLTSAEGSQVSAVFDIPYRNFEAIANLAGAGDGYGIFFMDPANTVLAYLTIYGADRRLVFFSEGRTKTIDLPAEFEGSEFRQFQIVVSDGSARACLEGVELAELRASSVISRAAIYAETEATVEMVRLTAI
jgi:GH43 family beta-xylosidase